MLYLSTPSSEAIRAAMSAGEFGCMTTPAQGNRVPAGAYYGCDNGRYGKGWPGPEKWWAWLEKTVTRYGPERCLFAVAPDTPFDAVATLTESTPWLARIRALGIPAAFAAQNGSEAPGMIPWSDLGPDGVIFLAGDTDWKTGEHAAAVTLEAKQRGLKVHMGRVNSEKRIRIAIAFDVDYADGTFFGRGPKINLERARTWFGNMPKRQPPHVELPLPGMPTA